MFPSMYSPAELRTYLLANWGSYRVGESTIENWRRYLQSTTLSSATNINELEMARLNQLGYTSGTFNDRLGACLKANSLTGTHFGSECKKLLKTTTVI